VSKRRREIEDRAADFLRRLGAGDGPVDPIQLANAAGLRVFNATFGEENIHGLIARRGAGTTVYVNANDKPLRKRFTVAHELGHFVLHLAVDEGEFIDTEDNFRTVADPDQPWDDARVKEWEANVFGAALLMPERLVRSKWLEIHDVDGLASWFQVSRQAMAIRLQQLGLLE
jgi:Zn-dependent peptidase ImmA (M78 family)